jgi:hypothetical protein
MYSIVFDLCMLVCNARMPFPIGLEANARQKHYYPVLHSVCSVKSFLIPAPWA